MDNRKPTSNKLQLINLKSQEPISKLQVGNNWKIVFGKVIMFLVAFFATSIIKAQDSSAKRDVVDMATGMRSNGKIYVVVGVLCIILAGVFAYLINLDKKISKLEKEEK